MLSYSILADISHWVKMINEGIHDRLKEVYDEFDNHCRSSNISYSIDADYYNVQSYRLIGHNDIPGVVRHMSNYVKDKWVGLEYDGFPVNYDDLRSNNFNVSTHNPLFKFTLKPLKEGDMSVNEDSIKSVTNAHGRKQASFPSSFRKHKTRDTYEGDTKKKGKKEKKTKSESLDCGSFDDRLSKSIAENVGLSIIDQDILLTRNADFKSEETEEESLKDAIQAESVALSKYIAILENTEDEKISVIIEGMIERCSAQIKEAQNLLRSKSDS